MCCFPREIKQTSSDWTVSLSPSVVLIKKQTNCFSIMLLQPPNFFYNFLYFLVQRTSHIHVDVRFAQFLKKKKKMALQLFAIKATLCKNLYSFAVWRPHCNTIWHHCCKYVQLYTCICCDYITFGRNTTLQYIYFG